MWLLATGILCLFARPSLAIDTRHVFVTQCNWSKNNGYVLDVENHSERRSSVLDDMSLVLGVADGGQWQYITAHPKWQYDHAYHLEAHIAPGDVKLVLDGVEVGHISTTLEPSPERLAANSVPDWANSASEYWVVQSDVQVSTPQTSLNKEFQAGGPMDYAVPKAYDHSPIVSSRGDTVDIEADFKILPKSRFAPIYDRYGQTRYADWPGKVKSDKDLHDAVELERAYMKRTTGLTGFDAFGGNLHAGWVDKATGFYHVIRRNGFFWLITPKGNPCFYTGVDSVPSFGNSTPVTGREALFDGLTPKTGPYAAAWVPTIWGDTDVQYFSYDNVNMIREYGADWRSAAVQAGRERLRAWGFVGAGKWSDMTTGMPSIPVLYVGGVPNIGNNPDVFDPKVQAQIQSGIESQVKPHLHDPYIIGWSYMNEYDTVVTVDTIKAVLRDTTGIPAKKALVDHAISALYSGDVSAAAQHWNVQAQSAQDLYAKAIDPGSTDIEAMREYFEDAYQALLYKIFKEADPNHLYFGSWISPGWWVNDVDWDIFARHCDVIGFDRYTGDFSDAWIDKFLKRADKPALVGEFGEAESYNGVRGFQTGAGHPTDRETGEMYAHYMTGAAANPYCVGGCWFEYRDEPVSGRGPGRGPETVQNENCAFGLVDVANRPKWDEVEAMRATNLRVSSIRLKATEQAAAGQ